MNSSSNDWDIFLVSDRFYKVRYATITILLSTNCSKLDEATKTKTRSSDDFCRNTEASYQNEIFSSKWELPNLCHPWTYKEVFKTKVSYFWIKITSFLLPKTLNPLNPSNSRIWGSFLLLHFVLSEGEKRKEWQHWLNGQCMLCCSSHFVATGNK